MSIYTVQLRTVIENGFDLQLNEYPIFKEEYRNHLNTMIINHYYFNEIGFETAGEFRFNLKQKMNEIMPKFNMMYNLIEKEKQNIENNISNKETYHSVSNSTTNDTSDNSSKQVYQDTPQGSIPDQNINANYYATNVTLNNNNNNSNSVNDNVSDTSRTINNNALDTFKDIKNKYINVDNLVIDELSELFMGLIL